MAEVRETLLALDSPDAGFWRDYVLELELTAADVPALIEVLSDPDLLWAEPHTPESWAVVHAWRSLAQLRAEAATQPLLDVLEESEGEDDWILSEFPAVFAHIGAPAIPDLAGFLVDDGKPLYCRMTASESLTRIAAGDPAVRDPCVDALTAVLARYQTEDPIQNACVIADLAELRATEVAPLMAEAFAADRVDLLHNGDWEDVQVQLGLLAERVTPRQHSVDSGLHGARPPRRAVAAPPSKPNRARARAKSKAKRKNAKRARGRNRKR